MELGGLKLTLDNPVFSLLSLSVCLSVCHSYWWNMISRPLLRLKQFKFSYKDSSYDLCASSLYICFPSFCRSSLGFVIFLIFCVFCLFNLLFLVNQQLPDNLIWPFVFPFIFFTTYRFCHTCLVWKRRERERVCEKKVSVRERKRDGLQWCWRPDLTSNGNNLISDKVF